MQTSDVIFVVRKMSRDIVGIRMATTQHLVLSKQFYRLSSNPRDRLWFEYPCNRTQLSSLASQTIGQTPEVTLYLYQL